MKTTPFPPKGMVKSCFVVITQPLVAETAKTIGLEGALIASCQTGEIEGLHADCLTLTNLGYTARYFNVPRWAVRRPYEW